MCLSLQYNNTRRLKINDLNDNSPIFEEKLYSQSVSEVSHWNLWERDCRPPAQHTCIYCQELSRNINANLYLFMGFWAYHMYNKPHTWSVNNTQIQSVKHETDKETVYSGQALGEDKCYNKHFVQTKCLLYEQQNIHVCICICICINRSFLLSVRTCWIRSCSSDGDGRRHHQQRNHIFHCNNIHPYLCKLNESFHLHWYYTLVLKLPEWKI